MTKQFFIFFSVIVCLAIGIFLFVQKSFNANDNVETIISQTPDATPTVTSQSGQTAGELITMTNGLKVQDLVIGTGAEAKQENAVSVHYVGTLTDGTKFDSSRDRGQPFVFVLGAGNVIQGWDIGVQGMKVGGKRKLIIPPQLAYGERGVGDKILPNSTLVFEIELLGIGKVEN